MQRWLAILVFPALLLAAAPQNCYAADCPWPPLNAVEQRDSQTTKVGQHNFVTGFYSWFVEHYHIDHFNCSYRIDTGPRQWSAALPDDLNDEDDNGNRRGARTTTSGNDGSRRVSAPRQLQPLQSLPAIRPLAQFASPNGPGHPLPPLPEIGKTLPALPGNLQGLGALPPLAPVRSPDR